MGPGHLGAVETALWCPGVPAPTVRSFVLPLGALGQSPVLFTAWTPVLCGCGCHPGAVSSLILSFGEFPLGQAF